MNTSIARFFALLAASLSFPILVWGQPVTNDTVPANMMLVSAGQFQMGDAFGEALSNIELPVHPVYVSAFYMDKFEVTSTLYSQIQTWGWAHGYDLGSIPIAIGPNHPVYSIDWYEVVKWCNARGEMEGRPAAYFTDPALTQPYRTGVITNPYVNWSGGRYRLPTEAEWEKAARGGAAGLRYPNGDAISQAQANISSTNTLPVGSFPANGYGLYDMAGNVSEWCWDWGDYYPSNLVTDPHGPATGHQRVMRGGAYNLGDYYSRVAARYSYKPDMDPYPLTEPGFYTVGFRTIYTDELKWKNPGTSGSFVDPNNWNLGRFPTNLDDFSLGDPSTPAGPTTITFDNMNTGVPTYPVDGLNVKAGTWILDLFMLNLGPGGSSTLRPLQITGPGGLIVGTNASLIVSNGTIMTPSLTLSPGAVLGWHPSIVGTPAIDLAGDFIPSPDDVLTVELSKEAANREAALIKVEDPHVYFADGKLKLLLGNYTPKAGDRFRLIQFTALTTDLNEINEFYRFQDYDPNIPGHNDLFWGLDYREDSITGQQYIEAVVLKVPQRWDGATTNLLTYTGKQGLVFLTHGTSSSIGNPADDALGELAFTISAFLKKFGDGTWEVATFDWSEFATAPGDFTYNAATSAQVGLGIGESIAHWMQTNHFNYTKMHLLSHSSGTWLVSELEKYSDANVQLTLFDAFVNPGKPCTVNLFCNRFEGQLGDGALYTDDFVEQYYDHSYASPPGTDERLIDAVNFDVTDAEISSPPQHSPQVTGFLLDLSQNLPLVAAALAGSDMLKAHAWPYQWYLESVRYATNGVLFSDHPQCSGFDLSPEFLDSSVPLLPRASILAAKAAMAPYDQTEISSNDCGMVQPLEEILTLANQFQHIATGTSGTYTPDGNDGMIMTSDAEGNPALMTTTVVFPKSAGQLKFNFQFTQPSAGAILTASVDGNPAVAILQDNYGEDQFSSGDINLGQLYSTGTHTITFQLLSESGQQVGIDLQNLQIGYQARLGIDSFILDPTGQLHFSINGLPGATNDYLVQSSTNLLNWSTFTNLPATNLSLDLFIPGNRATKKQYFRILAP